MPSGVCMPKAPHGAAMRGFAGLCGACGKGGAAAQDLICDLAARPLSGTLSAPRLSDPDGQSFAGLRYFSINSSNTSPLLGGVQMMALAPASMVAVMLSPVGPPVAMMGICRLMARMPLTT